MTENTKADAWHDIIKERHELRRKTLDAEMNIQEAMISYLKTVGETEDFSLRYESFGEVKLSCKGDLFDLHQIGDFCDVFNLQILITNRVVIEDYMRDTTEVRTNYLFTTKSKEDRIE